MEEKEKKKVEQEEEEDRKRTKEGQFNNNPTGFYNFYPAVASIDGGLTKLQLLSQKVQTQ